MLPADCEVVEGGGQVGKQLSRGTSVVQLQPPPVSVSTARQRYWSAIVIKVGGRVVFHSSSGARFKNPALFGAEIISLNARRA